MDPYLFICATHMHFTSILVTLIIGVSAANPSLAS